MRTAGFEPSCSQKLRVQRPEDKPNVVLRCPVVKPLGLRLLWLQRTFLHDLALLHAGGVRGRGGIRGATAAGLNTHGGGSMNHAAIYHGGDRYRPVTEIRPQI